MQKSKVLDIGVSRQGKERTGWSQIQSAGSISDLPILPETLLAMELMSKEACVDLSAVAELLSRDLGAVAQIFHCAAREQGIGDNPLTRLEDCISCLGVQRCLEALTSSSVARPAERAFVTRAWQHGAKVAKRCRHIANETDSTISANDASMVGLFHDLDELSSWLHWEEAEVEGDDPSNAAIRLARDLCLPDAVLQYFREADSEEASSSLSAMVEKAHDQIA